MLRTAIGAMVLLLMALAAPIVEAGNIIIQNSSTNSVSCTVDGGGAFVVPPASVQVLRPNFSAQPVIDWVNCGGLQTRMMQISQNGPDGFYIYNGQQNRVLNVLLYPYLPTRPGGGFQTMVQHIVLTYQQAFPDVLLNAVLNPDVNIYSYQNLPLLLGPGGYDVIELDTLYISFLAQKNLVAPVQISGDAPWPVGFRAASYNGTLYGIPSWLCMDFLYSFSSSIKSVGTLNQLLSYLAQMPQTRPALVGDYNGSWRLPSIYINAFVQQYGYQYLPQAFNMPPDPTVISNLVKLVETCRYQGQNNCINNVYHSGPNGVTEQVFATGKASNDMGFSEQSFFIQLYQSVPGTISTIPVPWGQQPQPLLFADAFVNSSANCSGGACAYDSRNFTSLMTAVPMKTYIAYTSDFGGAMPPRHLLVATQPFWQQSLVQNDPLYQQYRPVLSSGQPFPNSISAALQTSMATQICAALKAQVPDYACTAPATMQRPEYRR